MGAAVSTGVAVAGGLLSLNSKQKEAKRQKQMMDKQEAAQRMQADLQMFSLLQQRQIDNMSDMVSDAAQKQAYLQTQTQLAAQEMQQKMATSSALFAADVKKTEAEAIATQKQTQANKQTSDARMQAGAEAVEAIAGATSEEQQLVSSVLEQLKANGSNSNSIALLLDYAASAGGVNEALQALAKDDYSSVVAGGRLARESQMSNTKVDLAAAAKNANVDLAEVERLIANANTELERRNSVFTSDESIREANTADTINNLGIASAKAANEANYGIMRSSNDLSRQSRYLNSLANEQALSQGTALNSEILALQKSNVKSPGFFDYVGLGVSGYNTYKSLKV